MNRAIAIFDFDGTLVRGDSLPLFVVGCAGWVRTLLAALFALVGSLAARDRRGYFKQLWLRAALRGIKSSRVPRAVERLKKQLVWKQDILERLVWHKERGDRIVIASGGLALYLPEILAPYQPDAILCTEMQQLDTRLTGRLLGENCVREAKAERVQNFLRTQPAADEIWSYGNLPHDLPMMRLATHKIIV
jgi:phosphatidylglycerophosphatase C